MTARKASVQVDQSQWDAIVRDLHKIGSDANRWFEEGARDATRMIASKAAAKAASQGGATARVAGSIRAQGVEVHAGGGAVVTSSGATAGDLFFAAEYGAKQAITRSRWPGHPFKGHTGYMLWPTIRQGDDVEDDWYQVFDDMLNRVW